LKNFKFFKLDSKELLELISKNLKVEGFRTEESLITVPAVNESKYEPKSMKGLKELSSNEIDVVVPAQEELFILKNPLPGSVEVSVLLEYFQIAK
jgi:hypothetical protein